MWEGIFEKEKTCRACTKTDVELSSVFAKLDSMEDVCFSDMITECTIYTVQEGDELPHSICSDCKDRVRIAYVFKKQCEDSHRRLFDMIQSMKQKNTEKELFNSNEEEKLPENHLNLRKKLTRKSSNKYSCEKCNQNFANLDLLKEHIRVNHQAPRHSCQICFKEFIRLGHLTRHLNRVHRKEDTLIQSKDEEIVVKTEDKSVVEKDNAVENSLKDDSDTDQIDFGFTTDNDDDPGSCPTLEAVKDEYEEEKLHLIENFETKEEPKENEKSTLKVDKHDADTALCKIILDSSRRFQCDQCHKAFKRKSHLKQHSLCHTKLKPYQCTICEKRFGRSDNLKVHMSNHGQKHFKCNSCDRSFGQAYLLKRHKDQTHSEDKPFLCSECGQRFARNGDLAVHMRRHTGEKPYTCQYCNKGFTRSTEVYVHERYHTGEKRHVCSICGKAFQRPYNLLVHVRTHTGERPYQCPHCPKNFAQCSDLKAHIRRHTGERYRCDQCGMGFIHVFVLNQHKLSVHGIEVPSRIKRVVKLSTDTQ